MGLEQLRENWRQLGTYRSLLSLLGFEAIGKPEFDAYRVLMAAGALDLNNSLPPPAATDRQPLGSGDIPEP